MFSVPCRLTATIDCHCSGDVSRKFAKRSIPALLTSTSTPPCSGGIIAFTKSIARELARTGIRLNTVCPGPTDTPLLAQFLEAGEDGAKILQALERAVPMKRIGRPEDVPGIVAFLASDDAEYITGQVISVSGGLTMHG